MVQVVIGGYVWSAWTEEGAFDEDAIDKKCTGTSDAAMICCLPRRRHKYQLTGVQQR